MRFLGSLSWKSFDIAVSDLQNFYLWPRVTRLLRLGMGWWCVGRSAARVFFGVVKIPSPDSATADIDYAGVDVLMVWEYGSARRCGSLRKCG